MALARQRPLCRPMKYRRVPRWFALGVAVGIACTGGVAARAASWEMSPSAEVSQTYTDNIGLNNDNKQSEWITEVVPRVLFDRQGARTQFGLGYQARALFHQENPDRDRTLHEARGDGSVALVRRRLFLDGNILRRAELNIGDQIVPDTALFGGDTSVTSYGAGPRLEYEFGRTAGLNARYRRQRVDFSDSALSSTETDSFNAGLVSGPGFSRWGWQLGYRRVEESPREEVAERGERIFETHSGEVSVRAGRRSELFAGGGYDNYRYEGPAESIDGAFWEVGGRWRPRRNVSMEIAGGERFDRRTQRADIEVRGSSITGTLGYSESVETRTTRFSEVLDSPESVEDYLSAGGDIEVDGESGEVLGVIQSDEVFLLKQGRAQLAWERRHSRIALSLTETERHLQRSGDTELSRGGVLSWRWTRLQRTTVDARAGLTHREFRAGLKHRVRSFQVRGANTLTETLNGSLTFRVDDLDAEGPGARDYRVHRITLAVEKTF